MVPDKVVSNKLDMSNTTITIIIVIVITVRSFGYDEGYTVVHSIRNKRNSLIFPAASVLQLTMGVSAVLDLIGNPSGQMSYGFQQNIALPTNSTELLISQTVKVKRSFNVHDQLQEFFGRFTMNGTECLKKVICQVSETPLQGGLLEEIINFAFTPSNHEDLFGRGKERQPFLFSEFIGRFSGNCYSAFPECRPSPLDLISQLIADFL